MTDDVLLLPGQRATRLRDADPAVTAQSPGPGAVPKSGSARPGDAAARLPMGQAMVPVLAPTTGRRAAVPDSAGLAVLGTGTQALTRGREVPAGTEEAVAGACPVAVRTPGAKPVVCGRPAPGCTVVGGRAFEVTRREAAVAGACLVAVRTPGAKPVVCGRPAPGCTVVGGRAFEVTRREAAVAGACLVAVRTPGAKPVVCGRPAPGCAVVGGGAFEVTRREAETGVLRRSATVVVGDPATAAEDAGPVGGALRTGLPTGLVRPGDVPTGRAVARGAPGDTVHQDAAEGERR
ncbi:hypothetical protein [Streptomyces sp. SLBN-8D4]|uniref:hypothetical protein n=1 Tax=Streptomyces sp. SLBN-8D4 TaxID=3377728 RepID=UPI003C7A702B